MYIEREIYIYVTNTFLTFMTESKIDTGGRNDVYYNDKILANSLKQILVHLTAVKL